MKYPLKEEGKEYKESKETSKEGKEKDGKEGLPKEHKEYAKELFVGENLHTVFQSAVAQPNLSAQPAQAFGLTSSFSPKVYVKDFPDKVAKFEYDKPYIYEKLQKIEKIEHFEYVAGPAHVGPGDPIEQRLAAIESALAQLVHFIPQELRPDLSKGALKQEPDEKTKSAESEKKK